MRFRIIDSLPFLLPILVIPQEGVGGVPEFVEISDLQFNGSGCPKGARGAWVSWDKTTFGLTFDQFVAKLGPGWSIRDRRKNCQVIVTLNYPEGWSYSLLSASYKGKVKLDQGVEAKFQTIYYFQGKENEAEIASYLNGPSEREFEFYEEFPFLVQSECQPNRSLNINTSISLSNLNGVKDARGTIETLTQGGSVQTDFTIVWDEC